MTTNEDDLADTILAKSKQLTADDLQGGSITIRITSAEKLVGEQPIKIHYEGENDKPYLPGKSMRRVLHRAWGGKLKTWPGRALTLYRDDKVTWGGLEVGGIRISHMSNIDEPLTLALTAAKSNKKPFTVKPLETPKEDPVLAVLKTEGAAAAAQGVEKYTAWKDALDPDHKAKIKALHGNWAKIAKAADEKAVPASDDGPGI